MLNKYLDMSPPVAAAVKSGCPVVVLETGSFCRLPYPQNLRALQDAEQAIWQRSCVPCLVAVVNGRIKAGLLPAEMDSLMQARVVCSRGELPVCTASGESAAALPSAALAIARLAGVAPVILPGFRDDVADMDALALCHRMAFAPAVSDDVRALLRSRSIPVLQEDAEILSSTYLVQGDLSAPESTLYAGGNALVSLCAIACETALALKKKTEFT